MKAKTTAPLALPTTPICGIATDDGYETATAVLSRVQGGVSVDSRATDLWVLAFDPEEATTSSLLFFVSLHELCGYLEDTTDSWRAFDLETDNEIAILAYRDNESAFHDTGVPLDWRFNEDQDQDDLDDPDFDPDFTDEDAIDALLLDALLDYQDEE